MSVIIQTLPPPELTDEVLAFAAAKGVSAYLPAVAEMTRRVFPHARIKVEVVEDPELSYNTQIIFDVDGSGMDDEEEMLRAWHQWTTELFKVCPATHVHVFSFLTFPWQ